ncbi:MAG: glycosyltransferase family 4 protein [Longimicrobiales bacterium]
MLPPTAPRVAFVSHTAEWVGPTNSLSLLLAKVKSKYHLRVFVPGQGPFTERLEEIGVPYESFNALDKWDVLPLRRSIAQWNADLVYANNTHGSSRVAFLASRLAGVPFVTHVRGMAWTQKWTRMGYLRFAHGVVAVSRACADSVRRFAGDERLVVVHNGIPQSSEVAVGDLAAVRTGLGVPSDAFMITSVSHVMPRKGQEYGLEAFRRVVDARPEAHLVLVGRTDRDPDYVEAFRAEAKAAGLEDRVHLAGFRRDVEAILSASSAFLHTALADPHPRSVIEAMAQGLPVVAFGVDGVAETVVDGETGILAPAEDVEGLSQGLLKLMESGDLAENMGRAGEARAKAHFTDEATAVGVAKVIDAVLAGKGPVQ